MFPMNRLPSLADVQELYTQFHTPLHIQEHMRAVASVAVQLGAARNNVPSNTVPVHIELLEMAGLLHDLVRIPDQWPHLPDDISTPESHAEINYQILRHQYPALANTVRTHSLMTILQPAPFETSEQKILFYADKRVNHSTVVSLQQRIQLGQERWGVSPQDDQSSTLLPLLYQLEKDLFQSLTILPEELHA